MKKSTTTTDAGVVINDSNKAEYEARLSEIMATEVCNSNVSTTMATVLNAIGERLYNRAMQDKDALVAAGLPADTFGKLKDAPGACRYAGAELKAALEYVSKWHLEAPAGFAMVETIRQALLYALSDNPDLVKIVREMTKSTAGSAMVQQLQDCATFGRLHRQALEAIGFDLSLLDKAEELSACLANLLGASSRDAVIEVKVIRDKAYTYLKNLIMKVRTCGQYVFRNDKQHLAEYTGSLLPKKVGRRKKTENEETDIPALTNAA